MAQRGINYSKWDHIECSDDDTEDLPRSIDKKSYERYQKSKRQERDINENKEKIKLTKKLNILKDKYEQLGNVGKNHIAGQKLKNEINDIDKKLEKLEKYKHWNVDNMCHVVEDRSVINTKEEKKIINTDVLDENQIMDGYIDFCENYAQISEEFIKCNKNLEKSEIMLFENDCLFSEHAETYLLLDCLEKEMNGEHELMLIAAYQQQILTQIRELSKSINRPIQDAGKLFFEKQIDNDSSFQEAVDLFSDKIIERAKVKKKQMDEERARESDSEVDPDVQALLDELPKSMLDAFQKQDLRALHLAVASLPEEKGKYYMRRCEEVGLWNRGEDETVPPYTQ